jgi:hypothetical protein
MRISSVIPLTAPICSLTDASALRGVGSVFDAIRIAYAQALEALTDRNAATCVARLEEQEDCLLATFRYAVLGGDSTRARDMALRHYPEVERMHAEMSRLDQHLGCGAAGEKKPGVGRVLRSARWRPHGDSNPGRYRERVMS